MKIWKSTVYLVFAVLLVLGTLAIGGSRASAAINAWTATSYDNVFLDETKPPNASTSIKLATARNEFEAAQIVVKNENSSAFTITGVTFSNLTSGSNTIASSNLKYQFVETIRLNFNSPGFNNYVREGAGWYPDRLTNAATIAVQPGISQPIWIRAYAPKTAAAGSYTGTATVNTTAGNIVVNLTVDVYNVTIPDAKDGTFNTALWQTTSAPISWLTSDPAYDDLIYVYSQVRPGFSAYSADFWTVMDSFAQFMHDYRNNVLSVNMVDLLVHGGSAYNSSTGVYTFNWSRFDEYIQFFLDRDAVKRLEGLFIAQANDYLDGYGVQIIDRDSNNNNIRTFAPTGTAKANNWIDQFVPALKAHLDAKGWTSMWYMHIGDEVSLGNRANQFKYNSDRVRALWPTVKLGDAVFLQDAAEDVQGYSNILIPMIDIYDANAAYYQGRKAAGDELWIYTSGAPQGLYMNRALDKQIWNNRLMIWDAFKDGATGYLHWGYNGWHYLMDDQAMKGDGYIVYPDPANLKLAASLRYEGLRDGIEDYELLKIVQNTNPALADGIVRSLVTNYSNYSRDTAYMSRMREILLRFASGQSFGPDLASGKTATASTQTSGHEASQAVDGNSSTFWQSSAAGSQWLAVDLGSQHQVDAVRLKWGANYATSYKVQTSYNGTVWADAKAVTGGDGGDDFLGINAKARYVRISATASSGSSYTLNSLEIGGYALPKQNLAAGKPYTASSAPSGTYPDSGYESTDGLPGGIFQDGRTWGTQSSGGTQTQNVTIDLGSVQLVNDLRMKRYENYQFNYAADSVSFSISTDGVSFTNVGTLNKTNASGDQYVAVFNAAPARYVKATVTKAYAPTADWLFIDEIEAYGPSGMPTSNLAAGRAYTKSAAPHANFPDTGNVESTDGILAGPYTDGKSYGYSISSGQTISVDVKFDLGANKTLSLVRVKAYDAAPHVYKPDNVKVYTSTDNVNFTLKGDLGAPSAGWFNAIFADSSSRYVKITATKTYGSFADWLFLDEIEIYGY
ncbi:glycoside hydrolase domain-containing protein [Cohnella sp. 56]|uniref:glycoside hydrolase domain-containing protein n=1 Tax=Cohnella sp. 56 TaxID=3113722 RepID=UPI0030EAD267